MSMRPVRWPDPDPVVAAAIGAMYGSRKTEPPLAVTVRDRLGQWLRDEEFAGAFGVRGRPGWPPSRLALVTVLQRAGNLTDRMAAEAVRTRLDWKYLLGLPLEDPGSGHSVLPEFRAKVADAELEQVLLDALLERLAPDGLVKAGGKQRTDSTHVVAAVAELNQLELAGESVRAAAGALTAAHPGWVADARHVSEWTRTYGTPVPGWHLPASKKQQDELAVTYAKDGYALLRAVDDKASPSWLAELPAVETLRKVLVQNYTLVIHTGGREVVKRREKQPEGDGIPPGRYRIASPYDADARWGAKRDESWLGYKLHVTETCDDAPPCGCAGPGHDGDCGAAAFPNLVTCVATTSAAVTDTEVTGVIDDALAAKGLAPGRHYPGSGYLSAGRLVAEAARHRIELIGPLQARHIRPGPRRPGLRPRGLRRRLRRAASDLPAGEDVLVMVAVLAVRQGRDRGHLRPLRRRALPGQGTVHQGQEAHDHPPAPRSRRGPGRAPRRGKHEIVPGRLRPPRRHRGNHAPGRQPRSTASPLPRAEENPPRPRFHGRRPQPPPAERLLERKPARPDPNEPPRPPRTQPRLIASE
jgi:transposase